MTRAVIRKELYNSPVVVEIVEPNRHPIHELDEEDPTHREEEPLHDIERLLLDVVDDRSSEIESAKNVLLKLFEDDERANDSEKSGNETDTQRKEPVCHESPLVGRDIVDHACGVFTSTSSTSEFHEDDGNPSE
jgi:hypothetical protein